MLTQFETYLQDPDEEERGQAVVGLLLLYGEDATDTVVRWHPYPPSTVRCVVCGCLHDSGAERVVPELAGRMKREADCQVRGVALTH